MKKLILGLLLLTSTSSFASTELSCRLYKQTFSDQINEDVEEKIKFSDSAVGLAGTAQIDDVHVSVGAAAKQSNILDVTFIVEKKTLKYQTAAPSMGKEEVVGLFRSGVNDYNLFCK